MEGLGQDSPKEGYILQVVTHLREAYPEDFIKVSIDTAKFGLKVSRRSKDGSWYNYDKLVNLPEEAYNISARTVPEGVSVANLPLTPRKKSLPVIETVPTN